MNHLRLWLFGSLFLAITSLIYFLEGICQLGPGLVATRFNFDGTATGWMSRGSIILLFCALSLNINAISFFIVFLVKRISIKYLNMPFKAYWTASQERMDQAVEKMQFLGAHLGVVFNFTLLFTAHLIRQENGISVLFRIDMPIWISIVLFLNFLFLISAFISFKPVKT